MSVDFTKIKKIRQEIKKLLEEHPELMKLQDEIDRELAKCGNDIQRRNSVIQQMMCNTWFKIVDANEQLQQTQTVVNEGYTKLQLVKDGSNEK